MIHPGHHHPVKLLSNLLNHQGIKKRKAEAPSLELISKKPKSTTSVAIELPMSTAGDNWKTLLERKRLEKLNKEKILLSSQTTSQHSIRLPEGQVSQVQVLKDDEVSQFKKLETKKTEPKLSKQQKELVIPGTPRSILHKGKSPDAIPQTMDILQDLHHSQVQFLENQKITPIPMVLEQFSIDRLPYEGIPFVTPQIGSLNAETQAEVRVRTILSALNTISKVTVSMIEEVKPCGHDSEIQVLKNEVQKITNSQETLKDQVTDLHSNNSNESSS